MRRLLLFALALLAAPSVLGQSEPDLLWSWSPEPRWLEGVPVREEAFGGGLGFGADFVFSTVPDAEVPPVVVVFDTSLTTYARAFDYRAGLADLGAGRFFGAAYDVSDPQAPRRLNVGFLEDRQRGAPDGLWNPDGSGDGRHEYLLVFASDYDGTGETYAGQTAYSLDTVYGLAARVASGRVLYESRAEMHMAPAPLRDAFAVATENGVAEVAWTAAAYLGAETLRVTDAETGAVLASADPRDGRLALSGLDPDRAYRLRLDLLSPGGQGLGTRAVSVRPRVSRGVAAASSLDPGRAGGSTYGDLWGYTAPDGTEYALLTGRGSGLSVIDVTAAPEAAPVEVGFVASPSGARDAKDVKVYGHHAYLVHEVGPIQIVDLSVPSAPVQVGLLDVQPGLSNGGAHNALVARDHLWVTGGRTSGNAGVRVYSLADPAAPALVGSFRPDHQAVPYYHDFEVRGDLGFGPAIYNGGGVDVLDVSDPADIRLVSTFTYPGAGAHNTCTTEDGRTIYVGDEIGSAGNWTRVFDLSDPSDVELAGSLVVDSAATVHNCYVQGDRLFVAHYTEGLRVFDVSAPLAPVEVAFFDTFREPGYGYRGAWTAYPYLPSGKILVSDLESGLFVVRLSEASTPTAPAPAASGPLQAWPNPAAGQATLAFDLVAPARVRLSLLDALGREVAVLSEGAVAAGPHRLAVPLAGLPAGVYLARLTVEGRPAASTALTVAR